MPSAGGAASGFVFFDLRLAWAMTFFGRVHSKLEEPTSGMQNLLTEFRHQAIARFDHWFTDETGSPTSASP
jgi:hypothetical protein